MGSASIRQQAISAITTAKHQLNRVNFKQTTLKELFGENGEPPGFLPGQWLPGFRIDRTPIFGRFDIESETRFYFLCLIVLAASIFTVSRLRRSGIGRSIIAVRDNDRSAAAFTLSPALSKLISFAVAGGLAGA